MAYTERQVEQFCGLHAFNMLFQERKLVWVEDGPEYINAGEMESVDAEYNTYVGARQRHAVAEATTAEKTFEIERLRAAGGAPGEIKAASAELRALAKSERSLENIKNASLKVWQLTAGVAQAEDGAQFSDRNIALNMAVKCEEIAMTAMAIGLNNVETRCTSEGIGFDGQIPANMLEDLAQELHYGARTVYVDAWAAEFDVRTADPNFIGIIVNYTHPALFRHYSAVVKYSGSEGIAYADSAGIGANEDTLIVNSDLAVIRARLEGLAAAGTLNILIFVSATGESAPTVALDRLRAIQAAAAAGAPAKPAVAHVGGRRTRRLRRRLNKRRTRR